MVTTPADFSTASRICEIKGGKLALPSSAEVEAEILVAVTDKQAKLEEVWPLGGYYIESIQNHKRTD